MGFNVRYISLGFSCQTRFSLDDFDCDMLRLPFDFNITNKDFLLECLKTDGESLLSGDLDVFEMPVEKWQGVRRGGILFWHDFPLSGYQVELGWKSKIDLLNQKYSYLWDRFRNVMRSDDYKKIYISNSQHNLVDYTKSESEFERRFGLDADFYFHLHDTLRDFGARNFDITFLNRNLSNAYQLKDVECRGEGGFSSRFVGVLNLPYNQFVAKSLMPLCHRTAVMSVVGKYSNACLIEFINESRAAVYVDGILWGEIVPYFNGFLLVMNSKDVVLKATLRGNELRLSDNTSWYKL